ncbi:MAG: hypothetical protein IJX94_04115 [Clostridia bacterium]|nr:hypothetical protein [Clostridia bacterium]
MENEQKMADPSRDVIAGAMETILAHPELISMVASALGGTPKGADGKSDAEQEAVAPSEPSDTPVSVTEDPSEKVSDVMATLSPLLTGLSKGKLGGGRGEDDKRACLLRALKPYVSQGRREAIDYMITLSRITDLLKQLS